MRHATRVCRAGADWVSVIFSIAAGFSMVFATAIVSFAQSIDGQFTLPVFVALDVAYMFMVRIK